MSDISYLRSPEPFWFVSSELSVALLRSEISKVNELIEQHPQFSDLFDAPEATESERKLCFALLAHRQVTDIVGEMLAARYEPLSLSDDESRVLSSVNSLVPGDGPNWVEEITRVIEHLPFHLFASLPQALHVGRFSNNTPAQSESIEAAAKTLTSVQQIEALIEGVLNQQFGRLAKRWSVPMTSIPRESKTRKIRRTRDKVRMMRDRMIAEIDDVSETNTEFLRLMDEREVKPLPTWSGWPGSWKEAYKNPRLRRLIQQDKSRALSRARHKK